MGQDMRYQYLLHHQARKAQTSLYPISYFTYVGFHSCLTVLRVINLLSTLCILMGFLIYIDTISMGLPIVYFKGTRVNFLNYVVFLSLNIVLILANSADPDEMQQYAAFHLGLHCWPKYLSRGFQNTKG